MNILSRDIQSHWTPIRHFFSVHNEEEYDRAAELLDSLIDEIGADEQHPLYEFLDTLGTVIRAYEEKHHPMPECGGIEMLRFFMEEHGLEPYELSEIGSEDIVLEILNGQRELTLKHIHILAERFHISPGVFV